MSVKINHLEVVQTCELGDYAIPAWHKTTNITKKITLADFVADIALQVCKQMEKDYHLIKRNA